MKVILIKDLIKVGKANAVVEVSDGYVKNYLEQVAKPDVKDAEVERLALGLEGVKRTTGQHPGGIIIVPKEKSVFDFFPYNFPADDAESN
jgi:DNA polymerase-3 subunit alpha (Gram-positive type)